MLRLRRGRPPWAVPVLLFLAVLIVAALAFNLANLDAEEVAPALPEGSTPPSWLIPLDSRSMDFLLIIIGGVGFAAVLYAILNSRVRRKYKTKVASWWESLASVLGMLIILALLFAWPRMVSVLREDNSTADPGATSPSGGLTAWPETVGTSGAVFLATTVLVTILVLAYVLRRGALPFGAAGEGAPFPQEGRREATEAVREAIADLELGGDVRTSILACFQRFCRLLGTRGITEQAALTPRELERLAVERLRVAREASGILTALFEEARYSEHALGEADRARAIASLTGIRLALEA